MFKDFLMKKMLESKMKGMPKEEQEKIINMITNNPELFQKIGVEIQEKMKAGRSQMDAAMEVMKMHEEELKQFKQ